MNTNTKFRAYGGDWWDSPKYMGIRDYGEFYYVDDFSNGLSFRLVLDPKPLTLRSGSWINDIGQCSSAVRGSRPPEDRLNNLGFRICLGDL